MTRRTTLLVPRTHDGTSRRQRALHALDPATAQIDERDNARLIELVQALTRRLASFEADATRRGPRPAGTWESFAHADGLSLAAADMAAYLANPGLFSGARARWLARPHFALLLVFLELLGWAREHQNDLAERHLDFFYREVLKMRPLPPEPDGAAVLIRLAPGVAGLRLPAGTALDAGRDSGGNPRIYRTLRDATLNCAAVAELRSLRVDRPILGLADPRKNGRLDASQAFEAMLALALGDPRPGDPIPVWRERAIDTAFFASLKDALAIARPDGGLYLAHHELRDLMWLKRRRESGAEWPRICALLGDLSPPDPRDFDANLARAIGQPLDFERDGLPQVEGIDSLYLHRNEPEVRAFIDDKLKAVGFERFAALMPLKLRVDAEWAQIRRILERAGQRRRGSDGWTLDSAGVSPTDFAAALAQALDGTSPDWPWGCRDIADYDNALRELGRHLALPIERIARLADFAAAIVRSAAPPEAVRALAVERWEEVETILAEARREKVYARRRDELARARGDAEGTAGLDRVVAHALVRPAAAPLDWPEARQQLVQAGHLRPAQIDLLDRFRARLAAANASDGPDWPEACQVLELAWRGAAELPEPLAERTDWRNLYAFADARACMNRPGSPRWKTFGRVPEAAPDKPPAPSIGWALSSPLLALSQGQRTLTLAMALRPQGLDRDALRLALGLDTHPASEEALTAALGRIWLVEVSTSAGWIELAIARASVADPAASAGAETPIEVQIAVAAGPECDPLAPLEDSADPWPTLRILLRPIWNERILQWTTIAGPFETCEVERVRLAVAVEGLVDLRLQREDLPLDPNKPFEPFGVAPVPGARLYLAHPEILGNRLDRLRIDIEWMGMPPDLKEHYANYPGIAGSASFRADLALIDRNRVFPLAEGAALFAGDTLARASIGFSFPQPVALPGKGLDSEARRGLQDPDDLRTASRVLVLELKSDFGHSVYPALAARRSGELAMAIAAGAIGTRPSDYLVNPPYTPTVKRIAAAYSAAVEIAIDAAHPVGAHRLLHLDPFGTSPIDANEPTLLPRRDQAGELYIGLAGVRPPQSVSLLIQLAEGTGDPDLETAPVTWHYLDGDRWRALELREDATRGLANSGILEAVLPQAAPSGRLPGGLYWLRVAVARNPDATNDCIDIRAQAVAVRLADGANAPDHYLAPLPPESIVRPVEADARIAEVTQPFTSSGARPGESPERLRVRVAERLRHRGRALAPWDYEHLVLARFPQVAKVKCLSAGDDPGRVRVLIVPDLRATRPRDPFAPHAPADLLAEIRDWLARRAPPSARIEVLNPRYLPVCVRLRVRFQPGIDWAHGERRLAADLIRFLSPWAYDEGAEWPVGGHIYANAILDFACRRDYIDYATGIELCWPDGGGGWIPVPSGDGAYRVAAPHPDQILVPAREHRIEPVPELAEDSPARTGIGFVALGLDFVVAADLPSAADDGGGAAVGIGAMRLGLDLVVAPDRIFPAAASAAPQATPATSEAPERAQPAGSGAASVGRDPIVAADPLPTGIGSMTLELDFIVGA